MTSGAEVPLIGDPSTALNYTLRTRYRYFCERVELGERVAPECPPIGLRLLSRSEVSPMIRRSLKCVLVLAVGVALGGCGKDPEVAKREFLKNGQQYATNGKLKEAII